MAFNIYVGNAMRQGAINSLKQLAAQQDTVLKKVDPNYGATARQVPESGVGRLVNGNADAGNLMQGLQQAPPRSIDLQAADMQPSPNTEPSNIIVNENATPPSRMEVLSQAGANAMAQSGSAPQSALNLLKQSG